MCGQTNHIIIFYFDQAFDCDMCEKITKINKFKFYLLSKLTHIYIKTKNRLCDKPIIILRPSRVVPLSYKNLIISSNFV